MSAEQKPKEPIDLSHLGGQKILDSVAVQPEEPIDLSAHGGKRIALAAIKINESKPSS